jgi:hypothetical protein
MPSSLPQGAPREQPKRSWRQSLIRRVVMISLAGLVAGGIVAAAFGWLVLIRERQRAGLDLAAGAGARPGADYGPVAG